MIVAVMFAVLAAGSNAVGTVLQRSAALQVPSSPARLGLIRQLLRSPVWLGGILGVVFAALFQALALNAGTLAAVQPVFVLELPLALLVGSAVFRVRVSRKAWFCVVCIFVGLAITLFSVFPSGGRTQVPGIWWVPTLAGVGGAGTVLVLAGLRRPHGLARAACLATAAAIGNALTAALVKSAMGILSEEGVAKFFLAWQTYGFAAVGSLSILLLGYAMQGGPLIASQPALTLGDATVSFCLGVTLFAESPRLGLWLLPTLFGVALLSYGIFALSRTRCLAKCVDPDEKAPRQEEQPATARM
ncbi:putative integral membrane protein [Streptomyces bingchenggensis BCW-1]|uniref:Putative integral membrane protein n=1 Tax=Streptomyces bingchenggensis (strain BCW-1) TaxID=749414 RepID=D7CFG0_STRBB|nr:DMT family transporter [Streptomyces milbemycinicus]ADI04696.1 putative integral membrane protein [Streptomyces bingchenggensis BCW-1]